MYGQQSKVAARSAGTMYADESGGAQFGKKAIQGDQDRIATYTAMYDALLGSLQSGGSFRGCVGCYSTVALCSGAGAIAMAYLEGMTLKSIMEMQHSGKSHISSTPHSACTIYVCMMH